MLAKNQREGVRKVAMTTSSIVLLKNCFTRLTHLQFSLSAVIMMFHASPYFILHCVNTTMQGDTLSV